MDSRKISDCAEADPVTPAAHLPHSAQAQCKGSIQPSSPAPAPLGPAAGGSELTGAQEVPRSGPTSTSEAGADDKPPPEQTRRETKKREVSSRDQRLNWLMTDPQGWVGRKVRSRRNFAVYTVSQVYKTGRVKLERNWMTYLTDAQTVRIQYETYC